ncbi:hypothetical protein [Achromobacter aloeverae]
MRDPNLADGGELCGVIEEFYALEWKRYQARVVNMVLGNGETYYRDNTRIPPFTTVRFRGEEPRFAEELKSAVESYKGKVAWRVAGHRRVSLPGTNWVVSPVFPGLTETGEMSPDTPEQRHSLLESHPWFAEIAYADLLGLAAHVRLALAAAKAANETPNR